MRLFTFCSFATKERNLGLLVLEGHLTAAEALAEANRLGCNPGGQILVVHHPPGYKEAQYATVVGRLITGEELRALLGSRVVNLADAGAVAFRFPNETLDQGEGN